MDTGSIVGTVTDQTGAVISGAKVTLTNEGTGISLTTNYGLRRHLQILTS